MKKIILLLLITLSFLFSTSYASEKTEIAALSDKYTEIMKSIMNTQQKLRADLDKNELDYSKLESIYSILSVTQVQIDSIDNQLFISELVTDKKLKAHAIKFIGVQKESFAKQALNSAEYSEKFLTNIKSTEASLLILQARDIFKESAKILEH